jgi:hypothetical protein
MTDADTEHLTDKQVRAIERVIDFVVRATVMPSDDEKLTLEAARTGTVHVLRLFRLPTPDWLDDAIIYAAAFNERELDETAP